MAVVVDDMTYPMAPLPYIPIVHTSSAPVAKVGYHYAKFEGTRIIEKEFLRRPSASLDTPYEFYNRTWNSKQIFQLPKVFDPLPIIHRLDSKFHVEGQIPTIHLSGNASGIALMHSNVTEAIKIKLDMAYIGLDDIQTFSGVEVELAGRSSRWFPKLSYNIKMPRGHELFGRRHLKLRSLALDPSYIREQLSYDVVNSVGVPSMGFSYARVFIDNRAYGLFGFIETYKNPWQRNEFNAGKKHYQKGIIYQGSDYYSDLGYLSNQSEYSKVYRIKEGPSRGQGPTNYQKLIDLTKFIANAPTMESTAVLAWESQFNMECLLRNLMLEFMLGNADGYIMYGNNYNLYYSPQEKRFIFLPYDLDMTFGSSFMHYTATWGGNYTKFLHYKSQPLITKVFSMPIYKQRFENLMLNLAEKVLNPDQMSRRINDLVSMLNEDIAWDRSLPRASTGIPHPIFAPKLSRDIDNSLDDTDELMTRIIRADTTLYNALNGPTGYVTLAGLKDWIRRKSENTKVFLTA